MAAPPNPYDDLNDLQNNNPIPFFDKNGTAYSQKDREDLAKKKGLCIRCGIKTHEIKLFKRVALNNDHVHHGTCIRCNIESVPAHVSAKWESKYGKQVKAPAGPTPGMRMRAAVRTVGLTAAAANAAHDRRHAPSDHGGHASANSSGGTPAHSKHASNSSHNYRPGPDSSHKHHRPGSDSAHHNYRQGSDSSHNYRPTSDSSHNYRPSSSGNSRHAPQRQPPLQVAPTKEDYTGGNSDEGAFEVFAALRDPRMKDDAVLVRRKLHRLRNLGPRLSRTSSQDDQSRAVHNVKELMEVYLEDPRVMAVACGAMWALTAASEESNAVASETGVAEVVVSSLRNARNQREVEFVPWALGLLVCLASLPQNKAAVASARGIESIVRVLNVNTNSETVLEWSCRALHSLVHDYEADPDYREMVRRVMWKNIGAAVDAGCVQAVVTAMKNSIKVPSAEEWAMKLLWRLLDQEDKAASKKVLKKIKDEDGVVLCVDMLKERSTTPELFEMTVALICELLTTTKDNIATKSATEGIFTTARVMKDEENQNNESLQEACCGFLSTMAGVGKESKRCIDEAHGVVAIVCAMVRFPANRGIMEAGSHLLWAFSVTVPADLQQTLPDALQALTLGTEHHFDSAPLHAAACAFIANIAASEVANASDLPSDIPIRALSLKDATVREEASRALAYLSIQTPANMMETELTENLIDAALSSSSDDQEALCSALQSIAASSETNRQALVASGCLDAATEILQRSESESCAARAMELISALAVTDNRKHSPLPTHCVQAVVDAMQTKLETVEMRKLACMVLRNLLLGASPGSMSFDVDGLVDTLAEVLESSEEDVSFKQEACGVFWALVAKQQRQPLSALDKMFKSIIKAMSLHRGEEKPYNSDLQYEGAGALVSISTSLRDHTYQLENQAVDSVIAVMYMMLEFDLERIEVLDKVLDVIFNLSIINEGVVIQCGGIVVVIDAMVEHETIESIQERGCSILAVLSSTENLQVNLCIAETDGIDMIVSALACFTENERIQMDACKALSHLSVDHESRMLIASQGGLILVTNAMNTRRNRDNIGLLEGACSALLNISSDAEEQAMADTSVVKTVVDLMRYHPDAQTFQEKGLGVLQNVAMRNTSAKRAIAQVGGIQAVTSAMKEFMGVPDVLERAFTTMWSLAVLEQNQILIADAGGIGLVVNGMMANINYDKVQKQACGCLCTLSSNSRNKNLIRDAGGVDAIVFAMWAHYDSEVLQVEACRALSSLAVNVQTNEVMIATEGEISAIISAMRRFPNSSKLQEHACVALRNFLLSADNAVLIRNNSAELISLMTRAAHQFPDRCAERANQVLASLS